MKVKTFAGTHRFAVDTQVNNWLAMSKVTVRNTNVAFKALRRKGWDAVTGKAVDRRALAIAITIWYDDAPQNALERPANWKFGLGRQGQAREERDKPRRKIRPSFAERRQSLLLKLTFIEAG